MFGASLEKEEEGVEDGKTEDEAGSLVDLEGLIDESLGTKESEAV